MHRILRSTSRLLPVQQSFATARCRFCSQQTTQPSTETAAQEKTPLDVVGINFKEIVEPGVKQPQVIRDMKLEKDIRKALKEGSMIRNMFLSVFDLDFMQYPEILKSRHQYNALMKQSDSVNKFFKHLVMADPEKQISNYGFNNMWVLTKTEMINIYESIGESMAHKIFDINNEITDTEQRLHPILDPKNTKYILKMILNNCTLATVDASSNHVMRDMIYAEMNQKMDFKIAFAYSEHYKMRPGMDVCDHFDSTVKLTSDRKYFVVHADKDGILDDDYDYYLVFGRTTDYTTSRRPQYLIAQDIPYGGLIAVIVPKSQVGKIERYERNNISYQRIKIDDIVLPVSKFQVLEPEVDGVISNNYKGLVKLCFTALVVGQMKSIMTELNRFLVDKKAPLSSCDGIARSTTDVVTDVYACESALYYTAAMFDQLDQTLYPEYHLEAALTSTMTHKAMENILKSVREIIGPTHKLGPIYDFNIHLRDMIEEDEFQRVKVVMDGLDFLLEKHGKMYKMFSISPHIQQRGTHEKPPGIVGRMKRRYLMTPAQEFRQFWDVQGVLHPALEVEGRMVEKMIRLVGYCGEIFLMANNRKIDTTKMHDMYMINEIVLNAFKIVCMCARASRSYSETLRNADVDIELVKTHLDHIDARIDDWIDQIEHSVVGKHSHKIVANSNEYTRVGKAYYITDPLDTWTKDPRDFMKVPGYPINPEKRIPEDDEINPPEPRRN